jgi:ABC-type multidrug transport system fused ATPase/permease subunit
MLGIYSKLFDLLDKRDRRRFYMMLMLVIFSGLVEMVGVASILPFLAVVADPGIVERSERLASVYSTLGFNDTRSFQLFLGFIVLGFVSLGLIVRLGTLSALSHFNHMRSRSLSMRLFSGFLNQPYVWFLSRHSTNMTKSILSEVEKVVNEAMIPGMRIISQSVALTLLIGLLFFVNPTVALGASAGLGGIYAAIYFGIRRKMIWLGKKRSDANRLRYKVAHETLGGIKDVKLLGLEEVCVNRFDIPSRIFANTATKSAIYSEAPRYLLEAVAFGGMVLLVVGLVLQGNTHITDIVPTIGVFAFAGLRMFPAMQQIYNSLAKMRFVGPMLDNVHRDILETRNTPKAVAPGSVLAIRPKERLDLVDVHFAYPKTDRSSLQGLSLSIAVNSTVGIVGGTGAGKTTTVDLILGLLTPTSGQVLVDDVVISGANVRGWQDVIGYVPQQIYLMDDTVAANIAFGVPREKRDLAAIERAARLAELHDFVIHELPKGYDTEVGERGVRLSGGQRQRIGIARALYHDPDVLILDEATSALDNLTERAVMEAVHNLSHRKTIIMIAHRLTTVRNCDNIFLLEKGRLAAQGTYDELIAGNEAFRRMALVDDPTPKIVPLVSRSLPSGGA